MNSTDPRLPDRGLPDRGLLEQLATAAGAPGSEGEVRKIVTDTLARGSGELSFDRLGSVVCEKVGQADGPRVVLDGHMDEVAFAVQSVSSDGRIQFIPLGGWWGHVLLAQRVDIVTDSGRKIAGVIGCKPPHFLSEAERKGVLTIDNMYIDVGADSPEGVKALGVQLGDPIVPHSEFIELDVPGYLSCKAFDDRVGVGLMLETMLALENSSHPNVAIGVAATQEEVGCRGARTASALSRPDVAIVLEGTPADDSPGFTNRQSVLGSGPQIRLCDPTAISNRRLVRFVEQTAASQDIPVQIAVRQSGGTNASAIHLHAAGTPTVVIGVPARYIHTHVSIINWQDYVAAKRLLVALMTRLDREAVASFCDFGQGS